MKTPPQKLKIKKITELYSKYGAAALNNKDLNQYNLEELDIIPKLGVYLRDTRAIELKKLIAFYKRSPELCKDMASYSVNYFCENLMISFDDRLNLTSEEVNKICELNLMIEYNSNVMDALYTVSNRYKTFEQKRNLLSYPADKIITELQSSSDNVWHHPYTNRIDEETIYLAGNTPAAESDS